MPNSFLIFSAASCNLIVGEEVELHGRVLPLPLCLVLTDDVVDGDVQPSDEQDRVDDAVVELGDGMDDLLRGRRGVVQCLRAMGMFRHTAAIPVGTDLPMILRSDSGIGETLAVVAHREDDLVAHEMLTRLVVSGSSPLATHSTEL